MKKLLFIAALLCYSAPAFCSVTEKQDAQKKSASFIDFATNFKGMFTGAVAVAAATNAVLQIHGFNEVFKKDHTTEVQARHITSALIMSWIAYKAGKKSLRSWFKLLS